MPLEQALERLGIALPDSLDQLEGRVRVDRHEGGPNCTGVIWRACPD
jgi:hypothetical protein